MALVKPMGFTRAKSQTRTTNTTMTTHQEGTASSQKPEQPNLEPTKERILKVLQESNGRLTKGERADKFLLDPGKDLYDRVKYDRVKNLYYEAEQELVDEGHIERCRGCKGGIKLVQRGDSQSQIDPESSDSTAEESSSGERGHYEPVLEQIKKHWMEERSVKNVYGAVTAYQGRRDTGGRWSRPDIILCTVSEWIFSPRPEGEVRTIEVKLFDGLDIIGVYEALAHKSCSHYSYLMIVDFPKEGLNSDQKQDFDKIMAAADRHGIGIITVPDSNDWSTWEFLLEPTRSDAAPQQINDFLYNQFPQSERSKFKSEIHTIDAGVYNTDIQGNSGKPQN